MENKEIKILVIAKKYNDIYYAISLPEWKRSSRKSLIVITQKLALSNYPMQDLFDEVHCITPRSGSLGILQTLLDLKFLLPKINFDTVVLSNISLVSNKYILSYKRCRQSILIEDGYMNYYKFKEPDSIPKRFLMQLFGIKQIDVTSKIIKTYLLKPKIAEYFFGEKCQLRIAIDLFKSKLGEIPNLQGKKIFVGQPLYHSYTGNSITLEQYNKSINKVIKKYDIDYYVPHTMSDANEMINCKKLDIGLIKCTFEVLASMYDMEFYSVSSTILYSSKIVNPKCKSVMVQIPNVKELPKDNIMYKYADNIVQINLT
ncbi:glycosyltransferase family 52 [Prevotella merdae]|uniref:glycosyltransferase family 52 n=1 Tax=Prevotella merdae TaxID=2079531 RepID=UPI000D0F124C|nr:glycosyltransferase family 52 [Prevotella merdae]